MRDDLHGAAQVVALALLADDVVVDGARGDVGVAGKALVDEALVVPQVEVGLGAVVGDEDLAVLERAHGARVDVEVGVELLDGHLEPAALEEATEGGGGDALAERGDNAAGDEDVLSHAHPCRAVVEPGGAWPNRLLNNDASSLERDGRARGKDTGSARSGATCATEDAPSRRSVRLGDRGLCCSAASS